MQKKALFLMAQKKKREREKKRKISTGKHARAYLKGLVKSV